MSPLPSGSPSTIVLVGFEKSLLYLRITTELLNLNRRMQWMFECGQPRQWWPLRPGGAAGNTLRRRGLLKSHLQVHLLASRLNHILSSRADFWALAGIAAVEKGIENANEDCDSDDCVVPDAGLSFQWGRQVSDNIIYSTAISHAFR